MELRRAIPWSLVVFRACSGPLMVVLARTRASGWWLALLVIAALLSDIYDGAMARRWQFETALLRRSDSVADTIFYLGVLGAMSIRTPDVLRRFWPLLAVLLGLELVRYTYDFAKFGKGASYHSHLAKAWGLVMAVAVVAVLGFGRGEVLIAASLVLGIASDLEGLAMSIILPTWHHDVKTIRHALALRARTQPTV